MVHVSHIRKINKEGVRILPHIRKLLSALIEITTQYLLIHTEQNPLIRKDQSIGIQGRTIMAIL